MTPFEMLLVNNVRCKRDARHRRILELNRNAHGLAACQRVGSGNRQGWYAIHTRTANHGNAGRKTSEHQGYRTGNRARTIIGQRYCSAKKLGLSVVQKTGELTVTGTVGKLFGVKETPRRTCPATAVRSVTNFSLDA